MTIELATLEEHEAGPYVQASLEVAVGTAIIEAVSKIFEARIASLELVTKELHTRIEVLTAELSQLDASFEKEIEERIEEALESLEVESTVTVTNRKYR